MNEDQLHVIRHSLAHITAAAVQRLWPDAKFGVGPVVENGFYYDIDLGEIKISDANFSKIEKAMREIIEYGDTFERIEMPIDQAISWARGNKQPYKEELLNDLKRSGTTVAKEINADELGLESSGESTVESVSFYKNGNFTDLCRGPHVSNTNEIKGAFKLIRVAGAYWRGKETNPQMQRVYGVAFATQADLNQYLERVELAKQNDHKKLGREMELFFFDQTAPGMAYWLPKGLLMKNLLVQYWRQYHKAVGYQEFAGPLLSKKELFETSGHWDHYKDDMFTAEREDGEIWVLKPMSCPNSIKVWQFKQRSYKDLPLRFSDVDTLHRDEITGTLNGLLRTREFNQDDSHNFITEEQIKDEISAIIQIVRDFYDVFGISESVKLYLSTRPEEGYLGEIATWNKAEAELKEVLENSGFNFGVKLGDGAFYGPKIDIHLNDALGREWQCGTIQLDFQLPGRFELTYTDQNGAEKVPVLVHRVIYGSLERFIAVITEHFGGWYPFWFAPEQVRILTINDTVSDYVAEIKSVLDNVTLMKPVKYNEIRYTVDDRNESLGKKIREATNWKIPVQLIIGQKDKDAREVSIRTQSGEEKIAVDDLADYLQKL
jgi:threonyl-tRNA synthetase